MNDEFNTPPPSRSAKKRAAKAIEELAATLLNMADADYRRLPLSGEIARELAQGRTIKSHGARKRQLKHLAGMLRRDEESREAAETFVADLDQGRRQNTADFHHLESLRDRLCDPARCPEALAEIERTLPEVDAGKIRRLAESVHNTADKRAFREIFRILRDARPNPR